MTLSWNARRRWSLVLLLIGLPVWIILAVVLVAQFDRPPIWLEFLIYVGLGMIWALPFKWLFKGIGQADPDAKPPSKPPVKSGP
jgi:branched-subunit amino acid transport protein